MRVTVIENTNTGKMHGRRYTREGGYGVACGMPQDHGTRVVQGHYTDWHKRVTCKNCERILLRTEQYNI